MCDDDRGSGLVVRINDLWYLQGVATMSLNTIQGQSITCNNNMYSIFTRVSSHVRFISNVIKKLESGQQPKCSDTGLKYYVYLLIITKDQCFSSQKSHKTFLVFFFFYRTRMQNFELSIY